VDRHRAARPADLSVRGQGTLVPTEFRWASAPVAARVDRVRVQPGVAVAADTVLLELANPDAELAALTADRDVAQAEAELARLAAQLDGSRLAQESRSPGSTPTSRWRGGARRSTPRWPRRA